MKIRRISCILLGILLLTSAVWARQDSTSTPTPVAQSYTVVPGDTLSGIAQRYNTSVQAIIHANGIVNPNLLLSGTTLLIPPGGPDGVLEVVTPLPPTAGPSPTPSATPIPTPERAVGIEVGGVISGVDHLAALAQSGMSWAEVAIQWNVGDTVDSARQTIETMHYNSLKILLSVRGNAAQFHSDPEGYAQQFIAFLGQVAALRPNAIEVWSGMNAAGIRASDYAQILNVAFVEIKKANLQVLVVSGAQQKASTLGAQCTSDGCGDLPYLQAMADANVAQSADCIGVHYTLGAVPPDSVSGDQRGTEFNYYYPSIINTYGMVFPNKPLCFTEFGYLVPGQAPLPAGEFDWALHTTALQRASWLAQAVTLANQSGRIRLLFVYNIDAPTGSDDDPQANYAILSANGDCLACQTLKVTVSQAQ